MIDWFQSFMDGDMWQYVMTAIALVTGVAASFFGWLKSLSRPQRLTFYGCVFLILFIVWML